MIYERAHARAISEDVERPDFRQVKGTLRRHIVRDTLELFGDVDKKWIDHATQSFWDERRHEARLNDLAAAGLTLKQARVLDLAAGCGQFVFRALECGVDCWGIEPEPWKRNFLRDKLQATGREPTWADRIRDGLGEALPFEDNAFDAVSSYQTLEHVQDPYLVIREMVRVTRSGGCILIRCPDYRSTFEGHYRLPWLPLMPLGLARLYLRLLGRPTRGLETIQYVTKPRILQWISRAEKELSCWLQVTDNGRLLFENRLRRRGLSLFRHMYGAYWLAHYFRSLFRREMDVNIAVRVIKNNGQWTVADPPLPYA